MFIFAEKALRLQMNKINSKTDVKFVIMITSLVRTEVLLILVAT